MHALRPYWRALQLLALLSILLCVIIVYFATWGNSDSWKAYLPKTVPKIAPFTNSNIGEENKNVDLAGAGHPIERLMAKAERDFKTLLKNEARSLSEAAAQYRKKRGRHPPPGFDAWYNFATEKGALLVEDFWDQIYHDLHPFWGIPPAVLRHQTHDFSPKLSIHNNVIISTSHTYPRLQKWASILSRLTSHPQVSLPNMHIPFSPAAEPAMLVPWQDIDTALSLAHTHLPPASETLTDFSPPDTANSTTPFDPHWLGPRLTHPSNARRPRPFWSLVHPACSPDSPTRLSPVMTDIWDPQGHMPASHSAASLLPRGVPPGTLEGYVQNWTTATDACQFPALQGLYGGFSAPRHMSLTQTPFPLFGASKMSSSNEVLVPGAGDWDVLTGLGAPSSSSSTATPWDDRGAVLYWRGVPSGGRVAREVWRRLHRHRFVAMLNASHVEIAEALVHAGNESTVGLGFAGNFRLLPANDYRVGPQTGARLAEWVAGWADVGFVGGGCAGAERRRRKKKKKKRGVGDESIKYQAREVEMHHCAYMDAYFAVSDPPSEGQAQHSKFAAILDGDGGDSEEAENSLLAALFAGRAALRASVYRKWYDARLIPWLHFVPLDNTFVDLYGVMDFFLGGGVRGGEKTFKHVHVDVPVHGHGHGQKREGDGGHDEQARRIAEAGKKWAGRVLRSEDVLVYVYRLLLEYARVLDDARERLGWVGDLRDERK